MIRHTARGNPETRMQRLEDAQGKLRQESSTLAADLGRHSEQMKARELREKKSQEEIGKLWQEFSMLASDLGRQGEQIKAIELREKKTKAVVS